MSRMTLSDRLQACASRTAARLAFEQRDDGSFGPSHEDLASYVRVPSLFLAAGRWDLADRALGFAAERFMQDDGGFPTPLLPAAHPGQAGGWIAMAAQRLGRFEVSSPAWGHFRRHFHPELGGCCVEGPYEAGAERQVDMLMTAHLGTCALFFGDGEIAHRSEQLLVRFLDQQPDPKARLLLRMNGRGELVGDFDPERASTHEIRADAANQGWFHIGYPVAFLGLLHRVTTSGEALRAARGYLEFALACPPLPGELLAHEVAWAAAILGEIAEAPRYFDLSVEIARNLIAGQGTGGLWREGEAEPHECFDLSAEIALWLLEIARVAPIANRPERSRAEVTSTAWRRGVGAWSLRR